MYSDLQKKIAHYRLGESRVYCYDNRLEKEVFMSDLGTLKLAVKKFCEDRNWDQFHNPKDLAIGLATESSELLEIFRFQSPEQCEKLVREEGSREEISDELADVLFMLLRFSQRFEFDLVSSLQKKLEKNEEKYPIEKVYGSNKKYDEI